MGDAIFQFVVFGLIILGSLSFTLFIRRLLINASYKNQRLKNIEQKLDIIIENMEKVDSSN
ncbi:DUF4083 domain-containing protein [Sutcliffiella horikoshii]|uniref:DUF4083 domain-containing protein n=1 Tax=Sutcliffiella horikoshii TaxID=79883 RepID=A0A1Y0CJS1_9BACI|nr:MULTISPECIES: DUF4083 domain-containing protein [Bacillaceae]ART75432.1 DUF4083 domain-containing protein [Sutcliffiella horikoshii]TYS54453.1 DUF4083 domain-containing protein [Sutcliffiella horikoshii]